MSSAVPVPSTCSDFMPESLCVTRAMMSTGFVATRKIPWKPERITGSTMVLNTSVLRWSRSSRDSPGFWATPAQMATMSASAQSS